jgi:hypothetical protein
MTFRPLDGGVQELDALRELRECNVERETRRGRSALSGRIFVLEKGADVVLVKHNVLSELTQGRPSRFTRLGNSVERVVLALMREKLPQVGDGIVEILPQNPGERVREEVLDGQSGDVTQAGNAKNRQTESGREVAHSRNLIARLVSNDAADDESAVRQIGTDVVECLEERVSRLVSHRQASPE